MKLKGAIFDLDGTLIDSMGMWRHVGEDYVKSLGIEPPKGLRERLRDMSLFQAAHYLKGAFSLSDSVDEIYDGINRMIEHSYYNTLQLKNTTLDFLKRLREENITMCVATATDRYLVEPALKRLEIDGFFVGLTTCSEVGAGKDKPVIYEKALSILGTPKESTVVFEDALYAVKTAKEAGFLVAGVYDEWTDGQHEKVRAMSDWYLKDFNDWELSDK